MIKTIDAEFSITPKEMAEEFLEFTNEQKAEFFAELAENLKGVEYTLLVHLGWRLSGDARQLLRMLGEYAR